MSIADLELRLTAAIMTVPYYKRSLSHFWDWFSKDNTNHVLGNKLSLRGQIGDDKPITLDTPILLSCERSKNDLPDLVPKPPKTDEDFVRFAIEQNNASTMWQFVLTAKSLNEIDRNNEIMSFMHLFDIVFDMDIQLAECFSISEISNEVDGPIFKGAVKNTLGMGIIETYRSITINEYQELTGEDPILAFAKKRYFDPICFEDHVKKWTFDEFLDRERGHFKKAMSK